MISNKLLSTGLIAALSSILVSTISIAQTKSQSIELKVYAEPGNNCPAKILVKEKAQPYREGGFATDGSVNLSGLATNISMISKDNFSTTWVGRLKPKYAKCLASAGMTTIDGDKYTDTLNYLRARFVKGKIYFSIDLSGGFDPNSYPLIVIKSGLTQGNPTWMRGGTD